MSAQPQFATLADESAGRAQGFRVPRFELAIDGVSPANGVLRDVLEITYKDNVEQIDGFELVVANWDAERRRFRYMGSEGDRHSSDASVRELETLFEPCQKRVTLKLGYGAELVEVMKGNFTSMEPNFTAAGPHTMAVRGLNVLHRLRRKKYDGSWHDTTDSAIARSFDGLADPEWRNTGQDARRIPMPVVVDAAARANEPSLVFVGQKNECDIDFLWRRARARGYVVEVRQREKSAGVLEDYLYFGPSTGQGPTPYELRFGSGLSDIKITLTTANQVKKVTVRGWDRARQKGIEESVDWNDKEIRKLNPNLAEIVMQCDPREERVVTRPVFTKEQAKAEARAILRGHAQDLVKLQGSVIGLPQLRAGARVRIAGIGSRVSGEYFVTETTHTLNGSGYVTRFVARREDPDTGNALT